jgi:hypothetical protein
MTVSQPGTISQVYGFFSQPNDCFVIYFAETVLATVDFTGTVLNSISSPGSNYEMIHSVSHNHDASDGSLYFDATEISQYSIATLTLVKSWAYSLWGYGVGEVQQGIQYDPTTNALIAGLDNATEDFAWLFFPTRKRANVRIRYGAINP